MDEIDELDRLTISVSFDVTQFRVLKLVKKFIKKNEGGKAFGNVALGFRWENFTTKSDEKGILVLGKLASVHDDFPKPPSDPIMLVAVLDRVIQVRPYPDYSILMPWLDYGDDAIENPGINEAERLLHAEPLYALAEYLRQELPLLRPKSQKAKSPKRRTTEIKWNRDWQRIQPLWQQGHDIVEIAKKLGMDRDRVSTILNWAQPKLH